MDGVIKVGTLDSNQIIKVMADFKRGDVVVHVTKLHDANNFKMVVIKQDVNHGYVSCRWCHDGDWKDQLFSPEELVRLDD